MSGTDKGVLFDIKRYAIHDGPGIRTSLFLKGCQLRCEWCANPESQYASPEVLYNREDCTLCGECATVCPDAAIEFKAGRRLHDRMRCTGCGLCVQACPSGAMELCGFTVDVQTLWEQIKDDRLFWDRSGGGVTLSGGEPLLQHLFAQAFLSYCQGRYVHTAIETCGHVPKSHFDAILPHVDFVIFDLKLEDSGAHERYTGVSNRCIKNNLSNILKSDKDILVRMPLVPGCNDSPEAIKRIGEFIATNRKGAQLEILPYHRLGEGKYARLDREYTLSGIKTPNNQQLKDVANVLSEFDLDLMVGLKDQIE
jgi:pyruvate formate lyase activating enzyme